jgi:hypothetical protein
MAGMGRAEIDLIAVDKLRMALRISAQLRADRKTRAAMTKKWNGENPGIAQSRSVHHCRSSVIDAAAIDAAGYIIPVLRCPQRRLKTILKLSNADRTWPK